MAKKNSKTPRMIVCQRCGNEFFFSNHASFYLVDRDSGIRELKQRCPFCNIINCAEPNRVLKKRKGESLYDD